MDPCEYGVGEPVPEAWGGGGVGGNGGGVGECGGDEEIDGVGLVAGGDEFVDAGWGESRVFGGIGGIALTGGGAKVRLGCESGL